MTGIDTSVQKSLQKHFTNTEHWVPVVKLK